jgi:hypothetical protein
VWYSFSPPHPIPGVLHSSPLRLRGDTAGSLAHPPSTQPSPAQLPGALRKNKTSFEASKYSWETDKTGMSSKVVFKAPRKRLKGTFRYKPSTGSHLSICLRIYQELGRR